MSREFIAETPQIKKAVEIINGIENDKFPLILQRIALKIHSSSESSFKQEEIEKLEKTFDLNNESILSIIDLLEFIFLQAAYELIKPAKLQAELLKIQLTEDKVNAICELWKENGKDIIEKIRQNKTISSTKLKDIKWRFNLQLATDLKTKQRAPNAILEFDVSSADKCNEKNVQVEFSRDQLYDFLLKLETIQKQIDSLNG